MDYLDDSDYRQIYALKVLMNEDEDFEGDENVIASYDAACLWSVSESAQVLGYCFLVVFLVGFCLFWLLFLCCFTMIVNTAGIWNM